MCDFFTLKETIFNLEPVTVVPSYTERGIGRSLVEFAVQAARDKGLRAVELYTDDAMTENLSIYRKLRYIKTG